MSFEHYRSLTEVADLWTGDPRAPGDAEHLHRLLVMAICGGAFFDDGLALCGGGSAETVAAERLPDFEAVHHRLALHGHLGTLDSVPASVAGDPEAFLDWAKNMGPTGRGEAAHRLFAHVSINMRAFRNWCRSSGHAVPDFVADWPDSRPFDPNHRGRSALAGADPISLCEAVTWLTTGRGRPAAVLQRLMRRHSGGRRPPGLWHELEEDSEKLIAALRHGDLTAYGQLQAVPDAAMKQAADPQAAEPHVAVPIEYFMSDVFAEFALDLITADPLAWLRGTYPEGLPKYRCVRFRRDELWRAMRHAVRDARDGRGGRGTSTAAAGTRCLNWLVETMRSGPQEESRAVYQEQPLERFGVSKRQFVDAWKRARERVGNPEWGRAGRRPRDPASGEDGAADTGDGNGPDRVSEPDQ